MNNRCIECGKDIEVIMGFPQEKGICTEKGLVCSKCSEKKSIRKKYGFD